MRDDSADRSYKAQRVTLIGAVLDVALGVAKVTIGVLAHSHALIVDGIHSFSDVVTDAMVLLIARFSYKAPDREHPYGHARFETLGTVVLGSFLIALAGALVYDSVVRLWTYESIMVPQWPALLVAGLSILSKEWIYRYTVAVGRRLHSDMLIANAWHSRSDALSSVVVLVGVGGAMTGMSWLDLVAAIVVAIMLGTIGWKFAWRSVQELVESALPASQVQAIRQCVLSVPGVCGAHSLRSRRMGANALLDVHIQVDRDVSVSEGHQISNWVSKRLLERFDGVTDVTCHIDVENDAAEERDGFKAALLPLRHEVLATLRENWRDIPQAAQIHHITLHYLDHHIHVQVLIPTALLIQSGHDPAAFKRTLEKAISHLTWISGLSIWYGDSSHPTAEGQKNALQN